MNWEISFQATRESIERFAEFTGDRNPLHLDEQFARRFRYREPVAHGMLAVSYLLFLQNSFPGKQISFRKLSGQFRQPVFIGDEIVCTVNAHESHPEHFNFSASWENKQTKEETISASGEFVVEDADKEIFQTSSLGCFLSEEPVEQNYSLQELDGRKESISFSIAKDKAHAFAQALSKFVLGQNDKFSFTPTADANLFSALLLSTFVGMKLPGRLATFLSFDVSYDTPVAWNALHELAGAVTKISGASSRLSMAIQFTNNNLTCAKGSCSALVNPAPKPMLTSAEIISDYAEMGVKNKVVVITGASRGIGEVTAKLFAALGAKVVLAFYKGKEDAERIVCEILQSGGQAICHPCDVRDETQVDKMVEAVLNHYGDIDVLVNNAVKDANPKNFMELEWNDFLGELEVSVKGLHNCCRAVIPIFQKKKRGKIVNLSTVAADSPVTGQAKYITAKNAVVGYTRSLARELAKDNIQANMVAPNMVETDLLVTIANAYKEKLAEERDYGRHVRPIEVAQSIVFLSSAWSDAMTGQKIVLNLGENPFL